MVLIKSSIQSSFNDTVVIFSLNTVFHTLILNYIISHFRDKWINGFPNQNITTIYETISRS